MIQVGTRLFAKLEMYNPTGSVKDRIVGYIAKAAIERGELLAGMQLVEATSGNTGIALAAYGAAHNHPVTIVMPGNMSEERKQMMRLYGATILEVSDSDFQEAITVRNDLVSQEGWWSPCQFENPDNVKCHALTTGPEIYIDSPDRGARWEAFVSGAGTGGTMMGVRKFVQSHPDLSPKFILVVPAEGSDKHGIQGIGDGHDFLLERDLMDSVISVKTQEAIQRAKKLASDTGILVGISSGANLVAAERWIEDNNPAGYVVTLLCDRGERYLSMYGGGVS